MRLLLDTHVFMWAVAGSARLKAPARKMIEDAHAVYVSAASLWEIAIKASIGKVDADVHELALAIERSGFHELPVTGVHATGVNSLPRHHNDPFDHLLVSQAISEPLKLLTADTILARYSDLVILI